uniref:FAD-dependent oxidoreductase n=1 Tax=Dysosmobacter sp. TaxID=2591382 RepID=UPI003AB86B0A
MEMEQLYDVIVIGGGPAGLTAALYLARARYRVLVVEKEHFGGQITITNEIVNYPGVAKTSGRELTDTMRQQAEGFGAEFLLAEVTAFELDGDVKTVKTGRGEYRCFGVLLATGAHPRMIGFPGEAEFRGRGIAYCATCDGEFFTGKEVFVIGGGFAAAEESVFLTRYAKHVTVLIRGEDFSCAEAVSRAAKEHPKITVRSHTAVVEATGDTALRSLRYRDLKTGEETVFAPHGGTFGVFVFAGYEPETALIRDKIETDPRGYIVTDGSQRTSLEGVYAAGDVCVKELRQVVTAVGDGAKAATALEKYAAAMQEKTGLRPQKPEIKETKAASGGEAQPEGVLPQQVMQQLEAVFERMQEPLILELYLDEKAISEELRSYMEELARLTPKLTV